MTSFSPPLVICDRVMGNKLGKNNTYVVSGGDMTKSRSKMGSAAGPPGGHHQDRRHSEDDDSSVAASDDLNYSGADTV